MPYFGTGVKYFSLPKTQFECTIVCRDFSPLKVSETPVWGILAYIQKVRLKYYLTALFFHYGSVSRNMLPYST